MSDDSVSDTRWQARFVGPSFANGTEPDDPACYLRGEFTVAEVPRRATLYATAIGVYEPYLNGARVGDEVLAPTWTSYRHRLRVSRHDVTDLVEQGRNALGGIVAQGWALGLTGFPGKRNRYADRPALFLQLELEYADRIEVVGTGPEFRAGTGAIRAAGIYEGEYYDARREPEGWSRVGFADETWPAVEVRDWPLDTLFTDDAPPIRRVEELAPVSITRSPSSPAATIVDFGQNLAGWVRLRVSGEAGSTVALRHAEHLTPEGELDTRTLRGAAATDSYTLAGTGDEQWEPRFTYHGFRYVEIDGYPGEITEQSATAVVVHSDMTRTGWFETSHELLNRLHANTVWSMRGNFVGIPTDCPQRGERLGWTGDINAFGPTAAFLYDVRPVLASWLRDVAAEHGEKGYVPWMVPDVASYPAPPTALWSDVVVSLPWTLYRQYGEVEVLREHFPLMRAYLRDVESLLGEDDLWSGGFQFGDWLDPDAPDDNPAGGKTDAHLVACAYLHKTAREAALIADVLGEAADAKWFTELADRVRAGFRREYVTPSGRVLGETATGYALAIRFDLLAADQRARAGEQLAALVAKARYRISTGFAGTPVILDALTDAGHLDEAYRLLLHTESPSFLYPVTQGATTVWERWDAVLPDGTLHSSASSLNHYALGAITDWLHRVIGGLSPAEPGYRRMSIAPQPGGGLTHATVEHDTVQGRVSVSWRVIGGRMTFDVTLPPGTEAEVFLPLHPEGKTLEVAAGTHHWEYAVESAHSGPNHDPFDAPMRELASDPDTWQAVLDVLGRYLPGLAGMGGSMLEGSDAPLSRILQAIPGGASPELVAQLAVTLGAAR